MSRNFYEDDEEDFEWPFRCSWPFKDMKVGQRVRFEDPKYVRLAQNAAHTHGSKSGMKFATKKDGDHVIVKRIS